MTIVGNSGELGGEFGLDLNHRKELFSRAYVRAIASTCGYTLVEPEVDVGIDFTLAGWGPQGTPRSPRIDVQIKCTAQDIRHEDSLAFPLPLKNYDELRMGGLTVPRILVVVLVPGDPADWCAHSEAELALHHCGYWRSLEGEQEMGNTSTVTVRVPRSQVLSPSTLTAIMKRADTGVSLS
jgi:hypothetical protein